MRKLTAILAACILVFPLVSCSKDEDKIKTYYTVDPQDPEKIDIYFTKTYTKAEYISFVGESFDDYLGGILDKNLNVFVKGLVTKIFTDNSTIIDTLAAQELGCSVSKAKNKWGVKVYNYSYETLSYTGEPIKLSAALCVPVLLDGTTHTLSALSLCPPHMPYDKEFCPTANGTILMNRVAFNHAVVVPDYQGRGITSSKSYSSLHTHDHAVQAMHATLAAKVILESEGFNFAEDFPLYNVGVSEGGETSYEIHKMIENDVNDKQRETFNLKLTFAANGIAQHSAYITSQMATYVYSTEQFHQEEMGFYADAFDAFSEEEKQGHETIEFYSHDLLDANGRIILDSPLIKVLQEGVSRNDIPYNWNPQHPITLAASPDDDDVKYDLHTKYAYELIKNTPDGTPNENVQLFTFSTPVFKVISDYIPGYMLSHVAADVCCFVHAVLYEDPGSTPVVSTLFE